MRCPVRPIHDAIRSDRTIATMTPMTSAAMAAQPIESAHAVVGCLSPKAPATVRIVSAPRGRQRRLRVFVMPYSAMPDVAATFVMPHPRMTIHRTPMFQGPNGMLEPMPERMSQDWAPRTAESPATSAMRTSPATNQAATPSAVMKTIWDGSSWANAATTSP